MKKTAKEAMAPVRTFLAAWKKGDHETMYFSCTPTWRNRNRKNRIEEMFPMQLPGYKVLSAKKITEVVFDVRVRLQGTDGDLQRIVRVICEKGPMLPSLLGEFYVNPVSFREPE